MRIFGVELGFKNAKFLSGLDQSKAAAKDFANEVSKNFESIKSTVGGAFAALGAGALIKNSISYAGALQDTADALTLNVEKLQGYRAAFADSGTGAEAFDKGFSKLVEHLTAARDGNEEAIASFDALGISLDEIVQLGPGEILERMADGFANATDRGAAFTAVTALLGKSGRTMAAGLSQGSDSLREMAENANKMSIGTVAALDAIDDAMGRAERSVSGHVGKMLVAFQYAWDTLMKSNFVKGGGLRALFGIGGLDGILPKQLKQFLEHPPTFNVAEKMAQAMQATEDRDAATKQTGGKAESDAKSKETLKEEAESARLQEQLDAARLANRREMMTMEEKLTDLMKERARLQRESNAPGISENERLKKQIEAEKTTKEINQVAKEMGDKRAREEEEADKAYREENKKKEKEKAEAIARMKKEVEQRNEKIADGRKEAKERRDEATKKAKLEKSADMFDREVSMAKMTPGQRAEQRRMERFNARAEKRAERSFVNRWNRTHHGSGGAEELQRIKDSRDPMKQIAAEFDKAISKLGKEGSLDKIATSAQNIESKAGGLSA